MCSDLPHSAVPRLGDAGHEGELRHQQDHVQLALRGGEQAPSAPRGAASPEPPNYGQDRGWRSQEKTLGLNLPSPGPRVLLTLPSGMCFSLGLWMSSGWSSSLMVIP